MAAAKGVVAAQIITAEPLKKVKMLIFILFYLF
jgi:hypothetical protein